MRFPPHKLIAVAAMAVVGGSVGLAQGATNWPAFGAGPTAAFAGGTFFGLDAQQDWLASQVFAEESVQCVVAAGGRAFVVGKTADSVPNDRLVAFSTSTGEVLWRSPVLTRPNGGTSPGRCPAIAAGSVFVGMAGGIKAYDASSGSELWSRTNLPVDLSGTYDPTTPVVAEGVVYVAPRGNDRLMALSADTGATVWGPASTGYRTMQPPRVAGGHVLAPSYQGESQITVSSSAGALEWIIGDANNYFPIATTDSSLAYVARYGNGDNRVEARTLATGTVQWSHTLPTDLTVSSLALSEGRLFVAARCGNYCGLSGSKVIALDTSSGSALWTAAADVPPYGTYGSYRAGLVVLGDVVKAGSHFYRAATGDDLGAGRGWPSADDSVENYPAYGDGEVFALVRASGGLRLGRFVPGTAPPDSGGGPGGGEAGGGGASGGSGSCLAPPSGPIGVSINDGAQFTNTPDVSLSLVWPTCTPSVSLSNDGGFRSARAAVPSPDVPWRLESSGPERLPKTVYVRFGSSATNFTDDIILDQTAPAVIEASGSWASGASAREMSRARRAVLSIKARDNVSGVNRIAVRTTRSGGGRVANFKTKISTTTSASRIQVRVRDRAGNWSRWRAVAIK